MLTKEQNEKLTRVGPGTPCGEFLRRYWQPVGISAELTDFPRPVKVLGEDLVLFRDGRGKVGLTGLYCPHRLASLEYGFCELDGIRCRQHGWMYDINGNCLEQPAEGNSSFKDKIKLKAYPTKELGGLVFAYMGPGEPPILPRYDIFVNEGYRRVMKRELPANYLQLNENAGGNDPWHVVYTHKLIAASYKQHLVSFETMKELTKGYAGMRVKTVRPGRSPGSSQIRETLGICPTICRIALRSTDTYMKPGEQRFDVPARELLEWFVPQDDIHTIWYNVYFVPGPQSVGEEVYKQVIEDTGIPVTWPPERDSDGRPVFCTIPQEDAAVTLSPGSVTPRPHEHLGKSDISVIMWRRILEDGIDAVSRGEDPPGVLRHIDPNEVIETRTVDRLSIPVKA